MRSLLPLLLVACLEPTLEVGTGVDAFTPLHDGDDLPLVAGPQGGHHVWGALRATDVDPGDPYDFAARDNPLLSMTLQRDGDILGGFRNLPRGLFPTDDGAFIRTGETVILGMDPSVADGLDVDLVMELLDARGTALTARIRGTLRYQP